MMDTILEDYEFLDLSDASDFERSRIKRILVRPPSYDGCHRFQTPWNTTDAAAALTPNVAINAAPPPPYHGVQMNGGRAADNEDAARGGGGAAMYQGAAAAQPMMQPQLQQPPPRPVVQLNPQAGVFVNTQPFPSSAQYANYSPQTPEVVSARQPRGAGPAKAVNKRSGDVTASGHVGMAPPPPAPHVIWNSPPPMGAPHPHGYQFYTAAPPPPTPTAMVPAMIVGQFSPVAAYPPPLQQQHPLAPPPPIDEQELKEQQVPYNHHQHQHHHHHHALSQEHHHHQQQQHIQRHAPLPPLPHQHMQMPVTATVTQLPPRTAVQIMPPKFSNGHPVNSSNQLISNSSQSLQQKPPGALQSTRVVVIATTISTTTIENSAALPNLQKKPIAIASNTATVEAKTKAKPVAVKEEKAQQVGALNSASGGGGGVRVGEGEEKNVTKIVMTSSSSNDEQPIKQEVAKPASVVTEPSPKPNIAAVDQPPVAQQVKPVEVLPVTAPVTVPAPVTAPVIAAAPTFASLFSNSSSSPGAAAKAQRYSAPPLQNHSTEHLASNVGARSSREYSSPNVASRQPVASSVNASSAAASSAHAQKQSHSVNTPHHLSSSSSVSPLAGDPGLLRLAEYLSTYKLDHRAAILRPRGLTNRSNYCYINATLQALLACPPLYNLLKKLPLPPRKSHAASKSKTPIIDSMVQFVNEFEEMSNPSLLRSRREKQMARDDKHQQVEMEAAGAAFEPAYVYRMMNNVIRNESAFPVEGRQEDAEEFLSCLLNGLNDEMVELLRLTDDNISNGEVIATNGDNYLDQDSDNEWKEISKKKPTITRRTKLISTPLSQIFQGQWRSRVVRQGASETDNIQPFFTFPLDIEKAQSVKEALDNITTKNMLEGFTCPKTNRTIEAYQQLYLEELPLVLLLHLKCFDFRLQTCSKIIKNVEFSIELKIEPKLIASSGKNKNNNNNNTNNNRSASGSMKEREYKLFAVVYHDGKEATKGHYVTDVYHVGYGTWLRYDDANVRSVTQREVLAPKAPRVPYLLYYRRKDTIAPPPSQPSASASASAAASKPQKTAATES